MMVPWEIRQEYIRALAGAKLELSREMDRVQRGDPSSPRMLLAFANVQTWRDGYRALSEVPCDKHPGRENHCHSGSCGSCWLCRQRMLDERAADVQDDGMTFT